MKNTFSHISLLKKVHALYMEKFSDNSFFYKTYELYLVQYL